MKRLLTIYYILKVDPKKRILFDPNDSIDFNGNTGPFIQYTYARIQSLLSKETFENHSLNEDLDIKWGALNVEYESNNSTIKRQ